jgi:hypothetical protein
VLIDIHALVDMTIPKSKEAQTTTKAVQQVLKRPKRSGLSVAEKMEILTWVLPKIKQLLHHG